jgi:hypothetical protein
MFLSNLFKKNKADQIVLAENTGQVVEPPKTPYGDLVEKLEGKLQAAMLELLRKNAYIGLLEEEIDKLKKEKLKPIKKKPLRLVGAIVEVLDESLKEMNCAQILQEIQNRGIKGKKYKLSSVRATLYYLIKQKKIQYGRQRGTFSACVDVEGRNSPWDPR